MRLIWFGAIVFSFIISGCSKSGTFNVDEISSSDTSEESSSSSLNDQSRESSGQTISSDRADVSSDNDSSVESSSLNMDSSYSSTSSMSSEGAQSSTEIIASSIDESSSEFTLSSSFSSSSMEPVLPADTIHTLVVLIDFPDVPGTITTEEAIAMLNTPGTTGDDFDYSMRDYWWEVSRNTVIVENHVFGYYRAPQTTDWYNSQTYMGGVNLILEAFDWVVSENPDFDWDKLSLAEDGTFRGLSGIFSTRIPGSGAMHHYGSSFQAPNDVKAYKIVGTTLLDYYENYRDLFTILHEYGHMLFGWPDLYNTKGSNGTGRYELMSSQTPEIGIPNGSLLLEEGWVTPIDIVENQTITLKENGEEVAVYRNPADSNEFFVIEARNTNSLVTQKLPGVARGLYIWHIDRNVGGNYSIDLNAGQHYGVALEQADGNYDLENGVNNSDDGDAFVPGNSFTPSTAPNTNWWESISGFSLEKIQFVGSDSISFEVTVQ